MSVKTETSRNLRPTSTFSIFFQESKTSIKASIKKNHQKGHLTKAQIINPRNYQNLTTKQKLYLKV